MLRLGSREMFYTQPDFVLFPSQFCLIYPIGLLAECYMPRGVLLTRAGRCLFFHGHPPTMFACDGLPPLFLLFGDRHGTFDRSRTVT